MSEFKVIVVGAGLGGLCLAQSLRRQNIEVEVFERDSSPWDRPQGYRLHLDSDGIEAVHQVSPPDLYRVFDATSMKALPFTTIVNTSLEIQRRTSHDEHGGTHEHAATGLPTHVNVNRATLRQILLTGLGARIHFGKKLTRYSQTTEHVAAEFADGTTVRADVLVGADGVRSAVRGQRLPHAETQDSGIRAIYGRIPMQEAIALTPQQVRDDVFTVALDARKLFLGLGPVAFPMRPELAAAQFLPEAGLQPQDDYVVCIVGGRKELFGHDDNELHSMTSEQLRAAAVDQMKDWPDSSRAIIEHGDPSSFFFVQMYTSVPCDVPPPTRVTLVGDAIHAMTPTLGRGANVAMRDGARLGRHLADVARGRSPLAEALAAYEAQMTAYGFDVVRQAAAMGSRLINQNPLPPGTTLPPR